MTRAWFGPRAAGPRPADLPAVASAWLAVGSINHANGIGPRPGDDWLLEVDLPEPPGEAGDNTVWLALGGPQPLGYRLRDARGEMVERGAVTADQLFDGIRLGPAVRERVAAKLGGCGETAVPLFYVRSRLVRHERWTLEDDLYLYSQIRFERGKALFIRTSPAPYARVSGDGQAVADAIGLPEATPRAWLDEAVRLHDANALFLNNHQCYYKKCLDGDELEIKFTFAAPVDIWGLTVEIDRRLHAAGLPHYVPEFGDEFQKWDYLSHVYEIREPEDQRGYIAFIPTTDGRHTVKQKWFARDQLRRKERMTRGVVIDRPFDRYLAEHYRLRGHPLGCLRRVRYDVNLESCRTGHVYGIFFDHCTLVDRPGPVLSQCEVEYLRSRVAVTPDEDVIPAELDELAAWVEAVLDRRGLAYQRGYYSKLSFLRECATGGAV